MSTLPEKVIRVLAPFGTLASLLRNRDKVAAGAAGKLTEHDITVITGRGIARQWTLVAGLPIHHGTVADEAAMLALHVDSSETPTPRWVVPGDTCLRTDLGPGYVCQCISGNGTTAADWVILPRKAALDALAATVAADLSTGVSGCQPLDSDLTAIAEQGTSAWGLAWLALSGATAAKSALSITRADISNASTAGRALLGVATPTESSVPVIASDGSISTTPVADLGGGGSSSPLWAAPCVQVWYDTAHLPPLGVNGVAADAEAVVALGDLSRYGRAVTQDTDGNRPTWSETENAIKFASGISQYLLAGPNLHPNSTGLVGDFTLFILARRSNASGTCLFCGTAADNYRVNLYWDSGNLTCVVGTSGVALVAYTPTTDWTLLEIRWRGTTANFYANGTLVGTATAAHAHNAAAWNTWKLGVYTSTQALDLYLRRLVLLDAGASDTYCDSVRAALLPS